MDKNPKSSRSASEQMFSAYFNYLGVPNMENITHAQIQKIQDEGEHTWYERTFRADRKQLESYHARQSAWFEGDRFILHPDIYAKQIQAYLTRELPEILATYVRGQFTGSSDKITMVKIKEVCAAMDAENSVWWHSNNRKRVFLERFRMAYPGCCDGIKTVKQSSAVPSQLYSQPTTPRQQTVKAPPRPKSKKQQKSDFKSYLGLIILVVLAWVIYKSLT